MKNKFIKIFVFLLPLTTSLSSCSDFRKAVGKEKVIPDEFSVAFTPSLIVPPGYKIDPEVLKNNDAEENKNDFNLTNEINMENKNEASSFSELFSSKNVPKDSKKNKRCQKKYVLNKKNTSGRSSSEVFLNLLHPV